MKTFKTGQVKHFEFNGTFGACLNKMDDSPYIGLRDLDKKARIVIDIYDNDNDNEKEVRSQVVRDESDAGEKA